MNYKKGPDLRGKKSPSWKRVDIHAIPCHLNLVKEAKMLYCGDYLGKVFKKMFELFKQFSFLQRNNNATFYPPYSNIITPIKCFPCFHRCYIFDIISTDCVYRTFFSANHILQP